MKNIIVKILVIGFHHKRGSEVEFIYPHSNEPDSSLIISENWKNLCSLALPDGAHKNSYDVFHFILPSDEIKDQGILYGTCCFKQISSDNVKNKSDDITRNTIQKSVVVLSIEPFFNEIGSLLHGITENYFEIGDFSQRDILIESFHQLNEHFQLILEDNYEKQNNNSNNCKVENSPSYNDSISNLIVQGFSFSDLILRYEHNIFILIKLILLQRKLLFTMEPISKLTSTILCLVSLFPGEFMCPKFQKIMQYIHEDNIDDFPLNMNVSDRDDKSFSNEVNLGINECEKSTDNDIKSQGKTSFFQNIKSGGGQAMKIFGNFAVSNLLRTTDQETNNKNPQTLEMSSPLPGFFDKIECFRENLELNNDVWKDSWGFPLGIFNEKNILLPYASLGLLNVLENKNITSFVIGASNQLWRMKHSKIDVIINEDNLSGGIEFCSDEQTGNAKKIDDCLLKLTQLTVLDRRLADYLIRVIKSQKSSIIKSSSFSNISQVTYSKRDESNQDLTTIEIEEDVINLKIHEEPLDHEFSDQSILEKWLRKVINDYIKGILLSAAGWGTRQSFSDFGWDFMLAFQKMDYFKEWYCSVEKDNLLSEYNNTFCSVKKADSNLSLTDNLDISKAETSWKSLCWSCVVICKNTSTNSVSNDNLESQSNRKLNSIMNYDHPGKFIPSKLGDNLPGYYQMREYADQSKALVNRSVNEIKRIGSEKGGRLKSTLTFGLSKLSDIAKVHSNKISSSWWVNQPKNRSKVTDEHDEEIK